MAYIRKRNSRQGQRFQVLGPGVETRTFTNPADARVYMQEEERRIRLGEHYVPAVELFGQFLDSYLEQQRRIWAVNTYKSRVTCRKNLSALDRLPLNQVTAGKVQDTVSGIVARGAPRQAQMTLSLVKQTLHHARAHRHRVDESVFEVKAPKYQGRESKFLTVDEVRHIASYAEDWIHRIILVAAFTGMRQGELFDLKHHELDLDNGFLKVPDGKTFNARRTVYLIPEAVKLIREQLLVRPKGTAYVFPARKGGRWQRENFWSDVWQPARTGAGFDDVPFHALRHTFVSLAAREGLDDAVIGAVTGWSKGTVQAMLARYRHVYSDEVASAVQALERAVGGQGTDPIPSIGHG